jgi:hypothetical protein
MRLTVKARILNPLPFNGKASGPRRPGLLKDGNKTRLLLIPEGLSEEICLDFSFCGLLGRPFGLIFRNL